MTKKASDSRQMPEERLGSQPPGEYALPAEARLSSQAPHLRDVGIIALVPDRWEYPWWQVRHRVLSIMSRYFHVVWCNPAHNWRELWLPGADQDYVVDLNAESSAGFTIYHPQRWLPEFGRPSFLAHWTLQQRIRRARQMLEPARLGWRAVRYQYRCL